MIPHIEGGISVGPRFTIASQELDTAIPITPDALGNKGAKLIEMVRLGDIPVPPFFILTTGAWCETISTNHELPLSIDNEVALRISQLEKTTNQRFGDLHFPLFVSVRSGARVSMPGAMSTILNVGINDETVQALSNEIGQQSAWEAYFDLVAGLGTHAYGVEASTFQAIRQSPPHDLRTMVEEAKAAMRNHGAEFPQDPTKQLSDAITAVFRSWMSPEAQAVREQYGYSEHIGTAAIVQQMVWGNASKEGAGSAVVFTRDARDLGGEPVVFFAPHAQGPSVVGSEGDIAGQRVLDLPVPAEVKEQIIYIARRLETHYGHPQDIEVTYDGERLFVLQTRDERLAPPANFRWLQESVHRGMISIDDAKRRILPTDLQNLLLPDLDPQEVTLAKREGRFIATGMRISLGIGAGRLVGSVKEANQHQDEPVVLVLDTVGLVDIARLPTNVVGLVAGNGGAGSHVGVQASRLSIPVVFSIDPGHVAGVEFLTINGNSGEVFSGIIHPQTNGTSSILTQSEHTIVEAWHNERNRNPWRFVGPEPDPAFYQKANEALDRATETDITGPKALEYVVLHALIPREIRIPYEIVSITDKSAQNLSTVKRHIRQQLSAAIASGHDATIRTCLRERGQGNAPWWYITKPEDIAALFDNPRFSQKYGSLPSWLENPNLSEILIGTVPKGKLDPAIQRSQECVWELSCGESGDITLQMTLFTAHHRDFDTVHTKNLYSLTCRYDPKKDELREVGITIDESLRDNDYAKEMISYVEVMVLRWWQQYELQQILAAATDVFPGTTTPVLEGQARLDLTNPENTWCSIYGMKADPITKMDASST